MAWNYAHKSETERRRFGWRWDRCVKDDASRGRREDGFTAPVRNAEQEYASSKDEARREDGQGYEPMWRLRSEKEAERQKAIRDMEVREQLLNAREKVCVHEKLRSSPANVFPTGSSRHRERSGNPSSKFGLIDKSKYSDICS
ncbi:hypothetical protein M408DRAFT_328691 [Serendipita vermifera MAFF 305830]|uniref:Uncharacterized protein n=1 Tax=Serendipita vermifera MAFF 305830 TaxID=933852 RepID=A0A0C3BBB1_SERVB|nr:hypothetical protein M408DRAFT_328691 [Serendipita vermifera MAFF 305830]